MNVFFSGNEDVCRMHLPVVQSRAEEFAGRCKKDGLSQNSMAFAFDDTGTQVSIQYVFGQVQVQIRLGRYGRDYQLATPLSSMPIGSLKHLAFSRDGSTFRIFIDGVQVSSATANVSYATPTAQTIMLNLKALSSGIRVTRGHYRYNSNFTPVAPPFPEM